MKCVKKGKNIKRVSNQEAARMVHREWNYCPKHEWKQKVRDKKEKKGDS